MKLHSAPSRRAPRVSKTATPRHLITDGELRELVQTLRSTIKCNLFAGIGANTPRRALKAWAAERETWLGNSMAYSADVMTREEAEHVLKMTDECANMLRRLLPIYAAA